MQTGHIVVQKTHPIEKGGIGGVRSVLPVEWAIGIGMLISSDAGDPDCRERLTRGSSFGGKL